MIILRNYAVAMLTITPMALLMTSLAGPAGGRLATDRALTTLLGAAVAVVVTVVVHDTWEGWRRRPARSDLDALEHLGDQRRDR